MAAVVALAALAVPSSAAETTAKTPQARVIYEDGSSTVYAGPTERVDKKEFVQQWNAERDAERDAKREAMRRQATSTDEVTIMATAYLEDDNTKTISPGGESDEINVNFEDTLDYNLCCTGFITGDSWTGWYGGDPWYADTVRLTDKWTFRGVNLSVSASGKSWSVTGNLAQRVATWSEDIDDNWWLGHDYDEVVFDGFDVWVSHTAIGEFKFGSQWYEVQAYDSSWL